MMVSILCTCYNHEKFIREALDGFVSQRVNFPFEVIIHDDASTDASAEIIKEYESKYPDIVKPIYQTENQYKKRIGIIKSIMIPKSKGKYVAICEGDDYWIDPYKLQKQVDYMEAHPQCTLCFTNGIRRIGDELKERLVPWTKEKSKYFKMGNGDYDVGEMVMLDFVPTASLLFPRELYMNWPDLRPNSFKGDCFIRLNLTRQGYAHCIDEDMVVYRINANSVMSAWRKSRSAYANALERLILLHEDMNVATDKHYEYAFKQTVLAYRIKQLYCTGNYKELRNREYRAYAKSVSFEYYIKYVLQSRFYWIVPFLLKCKEIIKYGKS